jgi:hypothetical protein
MLLNFGSGEFVANSVLGSEGNLWNNAKVS